ncbi:MAG: S-layer homology domain-containing protein [Oscillospiraceae bacterium]|nr:S-layer homology domain-containing protein [Oscillospiraceae bacterium]
MKNHTILKKRMICCAMALVLCIGYLPAAAADSHFSDVPSTHWAADSIRQATGLGIIKGVGNGKFGLGQAVTRAEFVTMLARLFGWKTAAPSTPSFTDNQNTSSWYYGAIEAAAANGAVKKNGSAFRPNDKITREEMALMLVRALGYDTLAQAVSGYGMPFQDVTRNQGYIQIAYDFHIINGTSGAAFSPYGAATREQAAAMMMRLYGRYAQKVNWMNAFYAVSSYSQSGAIGAFDAVSLGWSRLEYTESGGVSLNTTSSGGNSFYLPDGYQSVMKTAQNSNVPASLDVYMSTSQTVQKSDGTASNACREILLTQKSRTAAVTQIVAQLKSNTLYSGVTIDFEGMRGNDLKAGFTAFLKELSGQTDKLSKTVYVCVPPATADGAYYDAYDFRAIGTFSDKVILMAHDYEAKSLSSSQRNAGFTTTPLTPIAQVYYALKAVTDPNTGVADTGKVALALSFGSAQWSLKNGKVLNAFPYTPDPSAIYTRLKDGGTTMNYSKLYENPYLTFYDSVSGSNNVVWYEDARSVSAKIQLARMFGVTGVSVWRLGLIPDYESGSREIYYHVLETLKDLHQ